MDVLEIKLATMDEFVDVFVIAESPLTFSGLPKPMNYLDNKERFAPWADKIRYIQVDDIPTDDRVTMPYQPMEESDSGHWDREHFQREALGRGLDGMEDDDTVIISDMDEILSPGGFFQCGLMSDELQRPVLTLSEFWLNWRWRHAIPVVTRVARGGFVRTYGVQNTARLDWRASVIGDIDTGLGWHFSYLGGVDGVRTKLAAAAHHELNRPEFNNEKWIEQCMETGADLFGRPQCQSYYTPMSELPEYVQKNQQRFAHLLGPEIPCL